MDAKLKKLRIKYKMEGYGLYWYCLELIAGSVEKSNLTFELEHDAEILANDTDIHVDRINEMMQFMIGLRLFEDNHRIITCLKMATRTDEYTHKLVKSRKNIPTKSRHTPDKVRSNRIEEKRIEEKRVGQRTRFSAPESGDVDEFALQNKLDLTNFFDYYTANGWVTGRSNKMKDWRAAARAWSRRKFQSEKSSEKSSVSGYNDPNYLSGAAI